MSWQSELFSYLSSQSAVTSLLGSPPRLYPLVLPENSVQPAASYHVISSQQEHVQTGRSFGRPRLRFNCFGVHYDDAQALGDALISVLDHAIRPTTSISSILLDTDQDMQEPDTGLHRRLIEFLVWEKP